jgi:DNA-binding Xre family transcriptional regulator
MTITVEPVVFDKLARDVTAAVAETLSQAREDQSVKYGDLVTQTGISRAKLDRILNGRTEIGVEDLVRLCAALDLVPGVVMREAWQKAHRDPQ